MLTSDRLCLVPLISDPYLPRIYSPTGMSIRASMNVWTSRVEDFLQLGCRRSARGLDIWDCRDRSFISHLRRYYVYFSCEQTVPLIFQLCTRWYSAIFEFKRDVSHMVPILRKNLQDEWLLYSEEKKKFYLWNGNNRLWYVGRNWPKAMRMWRNRRGIPRRWPHGVHPREIH